MILSKYFNAIIFFDGYFLIKEHTHFQKSKTVVFTDLNELIYRSVNSENVIVLPVAADSYSGAKCCDDLSTALRFSSRYSGLREVIKNEPWLGSLEDELLSGFKNLLLDINQASFKTIQFSSRQGAFDITGTITTEENLTGLAAVENVKTLKLPVGDTSRWFKTNTTDDDPEYEEIMYALLTASETKPVLLSALRKLGHFKNATWMSRVELATKVVSRFKATEIDYIENDHMRRIATAARTVNCSEKLQKALRDNKLEQST